MSDRKVPSPVTKADSSTLSGPYGKKVQRVAFAATETIVRRPGRLCHVRPRREAEPPFGHRASERKSLLAANRYCHGDAAASGAAILAGNFCGRVRREPDRKSTRLNSSHTEQSR